MGLIFWQGLLPASTRPGLWPSPPTEEFLKLLPDLEQEETYSDTFTPQGG